MNYEENVDLQELTDIPYKIKKEYLESLQDSVSMKEIQRENDGQVFYELTLPYLCLLYTSNTLFDLLTKDDAEILAVSNSIFPGSKKYVVGCCR